MAEQRKCNWKTDLILIESFYELVEDGSSVPTAIPDDSIDFKIVYRCGPDKRHYTAERQNGIYLGCKKIDDNNLAVFLPLSRHSLGRGLLSRELFLSTPDDNFDHGVRNICIPASTGCILSEGPSDGDMSPEVTVIVERLLKGDKGDPGEAGQITSATASVDNTTGTPSVKIELGGTPEKRTIDLKFSGLKGEPGEPDESFVRYDEVQDLTIAQQSQVFENLGWKVHVIPQSAINSTDAVSDDEKTTRLNATALLVQETGLLYNFSISSGGSRRFYGQFSNSFCTALNVNEATGVITSSFVYLYDLSAVSFDRNQSSVSDDNKNKALGNIGIDLVRLPYSLLNTTLSDEMMEVVDNARGIILVDTPSDYRNPTVFVKGNNTSGSCIFVSFVTGNMYCIFTLNKSTKLLSGISSGLTYGGSVRYAEEQSLTNTQKDTVLSNIGLDFIQLDYSLLGTTLDNSTAALIENAKGLILTNEPDSSHSVILTRSTVVNNIIYFNSWRGVSLVDQIVYNVATKALSRISSTDLHFDSVRYSISQHLTDVNKQQARTNIGVQSADELLADDDFIAQLKTKLGIG